MSRVLLILTLALHLVNVVANPLTKDQVPEPLQPWVDWVLENEKSYECPFFYHNFQQKRCSWPGALYLDLKPKKAQFSSHWKIYKGSWVELPGNQQHWPQNVIVNGKPAVVINKHSKPSIKLSSGNYKISGEFFWNRIPERLSIPKNTGLFNLSINNKTIPYPIIKRDTVWLKESDSGQKKPKSVENKLDLQVFRKVYDNVPLQLITFLELEVSGDQREIILPHALLADFIPISLKSPLPARIESDGRLLLQVRPGRWHIELTARFPKPVKQLSLNIKDKSWPKSEIWSFQAQPALRLVEIISLKAIDPSQSNVPKPWKNLPAYLMEQDSSMAFKVIRRGDPEPEPNQLNLKRQLWLDFNGAAYTVADTISGKMTNGWRLNALTETQLGQVKLNGQNQLVTSSRDFNKQGVEVRKGQINLQADSRLTGDISTISAVGWEQDFHQVQAELNIPPGWRLLAARGVDNVPNSWISRWTLLDLFLVLIAALAITRLWSIFWGVFSIITFAIIWHQAGAPHFIWLNILLTIALIRVIPEGKFQKVLKWYRNFCWLSLLIIIIPFMVTQVRIGLYPQLERQWQHITPSSKTIKSQYLEQSTSVASELDSIAQKPGRSLAKIRNMSAPVIAADSTGQSYYQAKKLQRIDPDANIQTGPGLPQWNWKKIHLSWNGAVDNQQQIKFWYLSPVFSMLINFLSVLLVLTLSLLMFGVINNSLKFSRPALLSWILLIPLISLPSSDVYAEFPDQEILNDLKTRLLQAPECIPSCAQISTMDLSITPQQLDISLQVHAQQSVAIPLPAKLEQWFPNQVKINGSNAQALIRTNNGELWLNLAKGLNQVELSGITPASNKFSLPLALKPHYSKVQVKGWTIEGIHYNGRTDSQLIITRVKSIEKQLAGKQKLQQTTLPPIIRIERTLHLGLDWRISTRVIRVFQNDAALAIKFPLLNGESVTSEKMRVKNKQVLVNMSSRQNSVQWQSVLKKSTQIDLLASDTHLWTEVWKADISPIWHVKTSGIAVVHHQDQGRWLPEWRPWRGEQLSLLISRPTAIKGSTLTIDKTVLLSKPGKRSVETQLKLDLRSSKGSQHTLTLPEQVQLQSVKIDGTTQPVRQNNSQVTLPIKPGKQQIILEWRKTQEQASLFTSAILNLGISSVNNHINVKLGSDRWVLFTSGPKFGPAVLFWGVLIVIAILSIGLGKITVTPLKHWHWFLLLIGLSQIPPQSAILVVIWLIALGIRANKQLSEPGYFNLVQIALSLLTLTSLLLLFIAVQQGLLGAPDMQIAGNQSSAVNLNWYQDRSTELLPTATIISIPLMAYRVLMLLWSLWLAISLLNWLKWGWTCFSTEGLWKEMKPVKKELKAK